MDNPIDSPFDLGLVNYVKHPENPDYVVFRFSDLARADSFEEELTSSKIWFERASEERRTKTIHLFGLHKNDFEKASKFNFLVEAKHKKKLISFAPLRYIIIFISLVAMTLAIMGYCESKKTLQRVNNQYQTH